MTPEQWLDLLVAKLNARRPYIDAMRGYTRRGAPLPEMSKNTRAAWLAFQRKARANWGGLAVEARADRIVLSGVTVAGAVDTPEAQAAARIIRDNRLEVAFADAIEDCLAVGYGYLVVGTGVDGRAVVTAEQPEYVIVAQDELQPWRSVAALKLWRHPFDGLDYALLWIPGYRVKFSRKSPSSAFSANPVSASGGGWVEVERHEFDGPVPVYELEGKPGDTSLASVRFSGGLSIIDEHVDLIDRINLGVLQRLVTTAIQAFKQRAVKGDLPEVDAAGNKIDWAAVFEPSPGALWELPEGIDIWESATTDIRPMLDAVKDDLRAFGALTGANLTGVTSDAANQSAEGVRDGRDKAASGAARTLARVTPVLNGAMLAALRIEGFEDPGTIAVKFEDPRRVTLAEKTDAASKMIAAGASLPIVQRDILGWSPDTIAEDERNRQRVAGRATLDALRSAANAVPSGV